MNKNVKRFLIVLLVLVIGYFVVDYAMFKMGEYLFKTEVINAEEVAGETDNNKLGIRNDVYDVIQKEYVEKMNLKEDEKILMYNLAYMDQRLFENFTNENIVLKYERLYHLILYCKHKDNSNIFSKMRSHTPYGKKLFNNEQRNMARILYEQIVIKNGEVNPKVPLSKEQCVIFDKLLIEQGL